MRARAGVSPRNRSNHFRAQRRTESLLALLFARRSAAGCECRGYQRQQDFMMAGDGVPSRFATLLARCGGGRALHYILQRSVVLHEIEIRSRDRAEGYTK